MSFRILGLSHVAAARSEDLVPQGLEVRKELKRKDFPDGIEAEHLGKLLEIVEAESAPKDTTLAFVGRPFALPEYLTTQAFSLPASVFEHIKMPRMTLLGSTKTEGIHTKPAVNASLNKATEIDNVSLFFYQYPQTYYQKFTLSEVRKVKDNSNNDIAVVVTAHSINEPNWNDWNFTPPDNIISLAEQAEEHDLRNRELSFFQRLVKQYPQRELAMNKLELPVIYVVDEPSPKLLKELDNLAKRTKGPVVLITSKRNPNWMVTLDKKESFRHVELPPAFEGRNDFINVGTMVQVEDKEVLLIPYKYDKEVLSQALSAFNEKGKEHWARFKEGKAAGERLTPTIDSYRNDLLVSS